MKEKTRKGGGPTHIVVTDALVEVEVQEFRGMIDPFTGIFRIFYDLMKKEAKDDVNMYCSLPL